RVKLPAWAAVWETFPSPTWATGFTNTKVRHPWKGGPSVPLESKPEAAAETRRANVQAVKSPAKSKAGSSAPVRMSLANTNTASRAPQADRGAFAERFTVTVKPFASSAKVESPPLSIDGSMSHTRVADPDDSRPL